MNVHGTCVCQAQFADSLLSGHGGYEHGTGSTCGGNAQGAPCTFPFEYEGSSYSACTSADLGELWCRTDSPITT